VPYSDRNKNKFAGETPMKRICIALVALGVAVAGSAVAQTPSPPAAAVSGRTLIATCSGCHGPDGKSPGAIPIIAGKNELQIRQAMLDFKNDRRIGTVMNRHAKGFSDDEIAAMAREIAATWR
jgi:cytochrome subunit of sulfide dehydrogenase